MKLGVDVADAHALIALLGGLLTVPLVGMCVGMSRGWEGVFSMAIFAVWATVLWTGSFALVLRGTVRTRVVAATGLLVMAGTTAFGLCAFPFLR